MTWDHDSWGAGAAAPVVAGQGEGGEVLGPFGNVLTELELETLWSEVPADAKPGDDGLIGELSVPQRLALPAAFHRPVYDDLGTPHLWHCAVCWGDGWCSAWPCEPAAKDGGAVVLDPKGVAQARADGAAEERGAILAELAEFESEARAVKGKDDMDNARIVGVQDATLIVRQRGSS